MNRWWLPYPTRCRSPWMGILLGLALSAASAGKIPTSTRAEATDAAVEIARDHRDAEPNGDPANRATLMVRGLVIDATTKRGIARFRVIQGARLSNGVTWQPHSITSHRGGRFDLVPNERVWHETQYRVEAEGYRPSVSRIVNKSEEDVKLTFALQADAGTSAVALTPDGAPADGAQAIWATLSREATGRGATISVSSHPERLGAQVVTADDAGRFHLPPEPDPGVIMVTHQSGYAEVVPADLIASGVVKLRKWCRVEGRSVAGTKPVAGQKVGVYRIGILSGDSPKPSWEDEAITDADGRFACDRVVPGRLVVDRLFAGTTVNGFVPGLATYIEVREGRTTRIGLGGPGRALVGHFGAPNDLALTVDWSKVRVDLSLRAPDIVVPSNVQIYHAFLKSDEGKAYLRNRVPVKSDGSFQIESVPPGDYD